MAFVDDDMTVLGNAIVDHAFSHKTLNDRDVEYSGWTASATANPTN